MAPTWGEFKPKMTSKTGLGGAKMRLGKKAPKNLRDLVRAPTPKLARVMR